MGLIRPPKKGFGLYYDPIYGYIPLPPFLRRALDLPSMQRLRHIKQLSTLFLFFPGATHSRFEHSVGVCHLARTVYDGLSARRENDKSKRDWPTLTPIHKIALQLGALFHDLGHGPLSHVSELFCEMKEDYRTLSHRELTEKWIKTGYDFYTDIPPFINEEKERIKKEYKQFVKPDDWGDLEEDFEILTPDNISKIATGKPTSDKRYVFLSNIVSGIFDVDRLDYLRRDAYHSGVNIGNIDIWEIINSYTLAEDNGLWIAKLMPSAVTSLEILLTIRDLTYRQFYYNKSHRTAQEMIIRGMGDMVPKISIDKMIIMNDEELLREFEGSNGNSFTEDVSQRIRITNIYESLPLTISVFNDLDENSKRRWYELAFGVPNSNISTKEWLSAETEASSKLKLPSQNKVIFDIRHVPIVNLDEYKQKKFYDENEKVSLSLFDLAPHLKRTKGLQLIQTDKGKFEIDSTRNYIEEISKLYILIPFEYLNAITESCIDDIKKESNKTEIYKKHIINLEEVVDVFIKFLDIKDENFIKKLKERFKKDMCIYLDEYIQTKT